MTYNNEPANKQESAKKPIPTPPEPRMNPSEAPVEPASAPQPSAIAEPEIPAPLDLESVGYVPPVQDSIHFTQPEVPVPPTIDLESAGYASPEQASAKEPDHTPQAPNGYAAPQQQENGQYSYQPPQYWQNQQAAPAYYPPQPRGFYPPPGYQQKSRLAAGLLGISFGALGVHNFYLGFKGRAIIQLVLCLLIFTAFIPFIWSLVEGILLIIGSEGRNYDGNGVILKD